MISFKIGKKILMCNPKNVNIPPATKKIGISLGMGKGFLYEEKKLKTCLKLNWHFQRGSGS